MSDFFSVSSRSFKLRETPVMNVWITRMMLKNMYSSTEPRAIFSSKMEQTPKAKKILNTLYAYIFPGNKYPTTAFTFVWVKFYELPHKNAQIKQRGNDSVK